MKREVNIRPIYECRCDERLNTKVEESTLLTHTWFVFEVVYYESRKRELKKRRKNGYRCDERLKTKT